jgi:hypothetical protein
MLFIFASLTSSVAAWCANNYERVLDESCRHGFAGVGTTCYCILDDQHIGTAISNYKSTATYKATTKTSMNYYQASQTPNAYMAPYPNHDHNPNVAPIYYSVSTKAMPTSVPTSIDCEDKKLTTFYSNTDSTSSRTEYGQDTTNVMDLNLTSSAPISNLRYFAAIITIFMVVV